MPNPSDIIKALIARSGGMLRTTPPAITHVEQNLVRMPPQDYLNLAMPFGSGRGPQADPAKVEALAKMEKWNTNPMFSVKQNEGGNYQVGLHDGRHRALAAMYRNDPSLNVNITRGQKFARENPNMSDEDIAKMIAERGLLPEDYGLK